MIRLNVQEYCGACCDFDPDVSKPKRISFGLGNDFVQTDTIVSCRYAKRCASIKRYLERQAEGSKNNEQST